MDWTDQVTAIATAVLAIGAVGAIGAAVFAAQQVREARIGREAEVASEFFRRWSDDPMVETRRLVATYRTPEALRDALVRHIAANDTEAYVLYRELDYFEQLGALEDHGGVHFGLIRTMLGRRLVDRWELWAPSIDAIGGTDVYPMFARLAQKMRDATGIVTALDERAG
jgi:hypothetical protein